MYALNAINISKSYRSQGETAVVLQNADLQIKIGEMAAIMGLSGSGKTTLLHVLSGVDKPDSGKVEIAGEDFTALTSEEAAVFRRTHIGMIFQDFQLLESLTVKENVILPLILDRFDVSDQEAAFEKVMKVPGIRELADRGIAELSGGQKQRVAAARALIHEPEIIFADEPSGSLDMKTARDLMLCMVQLNRQTGCSFLIVTHDAYTASFCSRVLFLQNGRLESELLRQQGRAAFQKDILNMWCCLEGGQDDFT